MSLSLEGIGAVLQSEDEYTKIVRLIPGGPAERSKLLQAADRIVGVAQGADGEMLDIVGWRLDEVVNKIRGPKGTLVRLEIIPADAADSDKNL
jgi:carboxyl-terminal processing protease